MKLNSCPFCGSENVKFMQSFIDAAVDFIGYQAWCLDCNATGPVGKKSTVRSLWNNRVLEESDGE